MSWLTILRKRENFRSAFAGFDFEKVARFNQRSVQRLVKDAGIVRHPGKIESTINNAKRAIELRDTVGSLAAFFWQYEPEDATPFDGSQATSAQSTALSKELKHRGSTFVGPTTVYAFMQAMGMLNDHLTGCATYTKVDAARQRFSRP